MAGVVHFKAIRPGKMHDAEFRRLARNAMRRVSSGMLKDFESTTETWDTKPEFKEHTSVDSREEFIAAEVSTSNPIWIMLNNGTRPHEIWAGWYTGTSEHKTLAFPSMFQPKTTPKVLGSSDGASGGDTVFTPYVQHPGTEARQWTKVIADKWRSRMKAEALEALRQFRRLSGRGL